MKDWSAAQYLKFEDERTRPARDLVAQIQPRHPVRAVVDIGCGPGNSTELLREAFPDATVSAFDSSPAMVEAARQRLPGIEVSSADVRTWMPVRPVDVLFANAVFQWLPDHADHLVRLMDGLAPGGILAVQMPDNLAEPTHRLMKEVAAESPWADRLRDAARDPLPAPLFYYDRLRPKAARIDLWHTAYHHVLADAAAIVEWVKGTGLKPFIDPLAPDERDAFLDRYTARITEAYPPAADGKVLLRFPRLFLIAERA